MVVEGSMEWHCIEEYDYQFVQLIMPYSVINLLEQILIEVKLISSLSWAWPSSAPACFSSLMTKIFPFIFFEGFPYCLCSLLINLSQVAKACEHLPRSKTGKIKIEDFINLPIMSEEVFKTFDRWNLYLKRRSDLYDNFRNKDGFISIGELKLANKKHSMREIDKVRLAQYFFDQWWIFADNQRAWSWQGQED